MDVMLERGWAKKSGLQLARETEALKELSWGDKTALTRVEQRERRMEAKWVEQWVFQKDM